MGLVHDSVARYFNASTIPNHPKNPCFDGSDGFDPMFLQKKTSPHAIRHLLCENLILTWEATRAGEVNPADSTSVLTGTKTWNREKGTWRKAKIQTTEKD